jgi:hypothetical protein
MSGNSYISDMQNSIKKAFIAAVFFSAAFVFSGTSPHPFYISVTNGVYNAESESMELSVRMFTDDVEFALQKLGHEGVNLGTEQQSSDADSLVSRYVRSRIVMVQDTRRPTFKFVGMEFEDDGLYVYLESSFLSHRFKKLEFENRILVEAFPDQRNIMHITKGPITKSMMMDAKKLNDEVTYQE